MPVPEKIRAFLQQKGIPYQEIQHPPAFTASETARTIQGDDITFCKVVMVKLDGRMAMVVLPTFTRVKFELLREITGARQVELATESEFRNMFPDCDIGAMPPFGALYGMEVWLDESLAQCEQICFNAGTHKDALCMKFDDFANAVPFRPLKMPAPAEPRELEPA